MPEYLALERASGLKYEYILGEARVLAGATEEHNRIALRVAAALLDAADVAACRVVGSDQKLQPRDDGLFYYPNAQLLCDPTDNDPLIKRRPCVVVEVTSSSTRSIDHGEKLLAYRGIPSLKLYLIVAQEHREVLVHRRTADGSWDAPRLWEEGSIEIPCLAGFELSLADIYGR